LGAEPGGTLNLFAGSIAEMLIYNDVKTDDEVAQIMAAMNQYFGR
jgi:hypothetical protein